MPPRAVGSTNRSCAPGNGTHATKLCTPPRRFPFFIGSVSSTGLRSAFAGGLGGLSDDLWPGPPGSRRAESRWVFLVIRIPGSDLEPNGSLQEERVDRGNDDSRTRV